MGECKTECQCPHCANMRTVVCHECRWLPCRCETHCVGCIPPQYSENGNRWWTDMCPVHFHNMHTVSQRRRDRSAKRYRKQQILKLWPWAFHRPPKSPQARRRYQKFRPKRFDCWPWI